MVKPSKHLIEYIENQNIEIQSIIGNLPEEMSVKKDDYNLDSVMEDNKKENGIAGVQQQVQAAVATTPQQPAPQQVVTPQQVQQPQTAQPQQQIPMQQVTKSQQIPMTPPMPQALGN